ncbi:hypothetical protein [Hahella ganghwensis]|uniref:hypothetical protein n=1 Tax=Hahella ganghwensis TaxID=286420 RepID=UPI00037364BB|nr:hypothetical protein [Hahella ganghwensis]
MSTKYCVALLTSATLLSGCIEKEHIVDVPDAENLMFASNGDLLVTGGNGVFQVTRETDQNGNSSYSKRSLFPDFSCTFTGLTQHKNWVFTACEKRTWFVFKNNYLFAANLDEPDYRFRVISPSSNDPMDSLSIPNGMAFTPKGDLLIADTNFFATSGIARVNLDFSGDTPRIRSFTKNWIGPNHGLSSANGLKIAGQYLYVSDGQKVKRFAIDGNDNVPIYVNDRDGNQVLNETVMWEAPRAIVDDIQTYCGGVALTNFISGRIHYVASYTRPDTGEETFPVIYSSPTFGFESPTSLAFGNGPWFNGEDILVTEKGMLFDLHSSFGNQLSRVSLGIDLNDPDACLMIQAEAESRVL